MHDFMQSLQIRCPVAAAIGLSMQIIASAPSGQPSARSLWNSEMRSSSGQPASVTPKADFLNGFVSVGGACCDAGGGVSTDDTSWEIGAGVAGTFFSGSPRAHESLPCSWHQMQ